MNVLADVVKIIGSVLLIVFLVPLVLVAVAYIGYFFGLIVAVLAGGVLAGVFGIDANTIPIVVAWLFVAGGILGGASTSKAETE